MHNDALNQRPRVLVAEDNPVNQMVTGKILSGMGCDVTIAATGKEAVARATEQTYDLVLMDLQMPEMGGLEASRTIRSMTGHPPVLIACTAHVTAEHRAQCRAAGMDDFLSKPLHREELEQTVQRWLGVARERSAHREPSGLAGSLRQLIAETDEDFVRQIVGTFARTGAELAAKATTEWRAGNRAATVRAIHSLKGAAGNLGAQDLMSACAAWERRADEGTLTEDDLRRLEKLAETTTSAVQECLKTLWHGRALDRP